MKEQVKTKEPFMSQRVPAAETAAVGGAMTVGGIAGNYGLDRMLKRKGVKTPGKALLSEVKRTWKRGSKTSLHPVQIPYVAGKIASRSLKTVGIPLAAYGSFNVVKPGERVVRINLKNDVIKPSLRASTGLSPSMSAKDSVRAHRNRETLHKADLSTKETDRLSRRKQQGRYISLTAGTLGLGALALRAPEIARAATRIPKVKNLRSLKKLASYDVPSTKASNALGIAAIGLGSVGSFNYAAQQKLERKQVIKAKNMTSRELDKKAMAQYVSLFPRPKLKNGEPSKEYRQRLLEWSTKGNTYAVSQRHSRKERAAQPYRHARIKRGPYLDGGQRSLPERRAYALTKSFSSTSPRRKQIKKSLYDGIVRGLGKVRVLDRPKPGYVMVVDSKDVRRFMPESRVTPIPKRKSAASITPPPPSYEQMTLFKGLPSIARGPGYRKLTGPDSREYLRQRMLVHDEGRRRAKQISEMRNGYQMSGRRSQRYAGGQWERSKVRTDAAPPAPPRAGSKSAFESSSQYDRAKAISARGTLSPGTKVGWDGAEGMPRGSAPMPRHSRSVSEYKDGSVRVDDWVKGKPTYSIRSKFGKRDGVVDRGKAWARDKELRQAKVRRNHALDNTVLAGSALSASTLPASISLYNKGVKGVQRSSLLREKMPFLSGLKPIPIPKANAMGARLKPLRFAGVIPGRVGRVARNPFVIGGASLAVGGPLVYRNSKELKDSKADLDDLKKKRRDLVGKRDDRFLREHRDRISPKAEAGYKYLRAGRNEAIGDSAWYGGTAALAGGGAAFQYGMRNYFPKKLAIGIGATNAVLAGYSGVEAVRSGKKAHRWNSKMGLIRAKAKERAVAGEYGRDRVVAKADERRKDGKSGAFAAGAGLGAAVIAGVPLPMRLPVNREASRGIAGRLDGADSGRVSVRDVRGVATGEGTRWAASRNQDRLAASMADRREAGRPAQDPGRPVRLRRAPDGSMRVIDGHHRIKALMDLGEKDVDVKVEHSRRPHRTWVPLAQRAKYLRDVGNAREFTGQRDLREIRANAARPIPRAARVGNRVRSRAERGVLALRRPAGVIGLTAAAGLATGGMVAHRMANRKINPVSERLKKDFFGKGLFPAPRPRMSLRPRRPSVRSSYTGTSRLGRKFTVSGSVR